MSGSGLVNLRRQPSRGEIIARLNDTLRKEGRGGRLLVTRGVHTLPCFDFRELVRAIAAYDQFNADNDPHAERDFGVFELFGAKLMWKIDYYDVDLEFGSTDPANPDVTVRVLTVMLASEY